MEEGSGEGPLEITAPPVIRIATYPVSWHDSCVQMSRFDVLYTGYIMILHRARLFYWGGIEGFDCIILLFDFYAESRSHILPRKKPFGT